MNNYLDIVKEQLSILDQGLLNITSNIIVFITKYDKDTCCELDNILNNYTKFIIIKTPENLFEKYAINNYKNYIKEENYYMYYFHTKGITRENNSYFSLHRKRLNYYTLIHYNINIKLLETYDAVGTNLKLYPKKHFGGNFWWSKSSYLQKLKNVNDGYLSPEMYVLDNDDCKYISLTNTADNPNDKDYIYLTETEIYQNLTSQFLMNVGDKNQIINC
jgi:hypothetical protein